MTTLDMIEAQEPFHCPLCEIGWKGRADCFVCNRAPVAGKLPSARLRGVDARGVVPSSGDVREAVVTATP